MYGITVCFLTAFLVIYGMWALTNGKMTKETFSSLVNGGGAMGLGGVALLLYGLARLSLNQGGRP